MSNHACGRKLLLALLSTPLAALLTIGCSNSTTSSEPSVTTITGIAYVIGTDAPATGVVSFNVQLNSVNAITSGGTSVSLVSGNPTVDFARFNGLQTLLDLNAVPVGTYTSIQVSLGPATIGYLNTQAGSAPTIQTQTATLSTSTITVPLATPLVVSQSGPVGLRVDFDLFKSIQVGSNGQITGNVTPTFDITAVAPTDTGGHIDDFDAAVVSVNPTGQSFVIQGPHGRNFTVQVNGQTEWDNNEGLSNLTTTSIVEVSGTIQAADSTISADEIAILSQDGFHAAGQITYVQPSSGTATDFQLYIPQSPPNHHRTYTRRDRHRRPHWQRELLHLLDAQPAHPVPLQSLHPAARSVRLYRRTRHRRDERLGRNHKARRPAPLGLQRNCRSQHDKCSSRYIPDEHNRLRRPAGARPRNGLYRSRHKLPLRPQQPHRRRRSIHQRSQHSNSRPARQGPIIRKLRNTRPAHRSTQLTGARSRQ